MVGFTGQTYHVFNKHASSALDMPYFTSGQVSTWVTESATLTSRLVVVVAGQLIRSRSKDSWGRVCRQRCIDDPFERTVHGYPEEVGSER